MSEGVDTDRTRIGFAPGHWVPVKVGRKRVTLRPAGHIDVEAGEPVWLDFGEKGDAEAEITQVQTMRVVEAAYREWKLHRNYANTEKLIEEMNEYYPERDIWAHDDLDAIRFDNVVLYPAEE